MKNKVVLSNNTCGKGGQTLCTNPDPCHELAQSSD